MNDQSTINALTAIVITASLMFATGSATAQLGVQASIEVSEDGDEKFCELDAFGDCWEIDDSPLDETPYQWDAPDEADYDAETLARIARLESRTEENAQIREDHRVQKLREYVVYGFQSTTGTRLLRRPSGDRQDPFLLVDDADALRFPSGSSAKGP